MAKYTQGIAGPFQGRVATVVGSSRNGVPYMKGIYKNRTVEVSKKELANRKKFAMAQAWLSPILDFVRVGFKGYSQRSQGFIAAKSWLLKNAFEGEGDNLHINPARIKVSSGDLALPADLAVSQMENGDLHFTWNPKDEAGTSPYDQIMMLAYDIEKGESESNTTGQFRKNGSDELPINLSNGKNFLVYAAFNADDRSRLSDSVYLGEWKAI